MLGTLNINGVVQTWQQFALASDIRGGELPLTSAPIAVYSGELWTAKQRQGARLHEVSYRACFKPQLPAYFIERLSQRGDTVYDPFSGRGTTSIEAALLGRQVVDNDINPLSAILTRPRLELPDLDEVKTRLASIPLRAAVPKAPDLSMFYHRDTLAEIVALRNYLRRRHRAGDEDAIDRWIRMVATNRLTGHSKGFFSVYTLPPNQATSSENQLKINRKLGQKPEYRDTHAIILHKSRQLQRGLDAAQRGNLHAAARTARCLTAPAHRTPLIADRSVQLTVTSPPFLDIVQYAADNWLRCWFNALDAKSIGRQITMSRTVADWRLRMGAVFAELYRITKPGGWVAFEVGEVRKGKIRLENHVVPLGIAAGFNCEAILINAQRFTKTANIWGVGNNEAGTNSNRIVVFRRPDRT
jgi:SAM-dependent methyltransferase